MSFVLGTAGVKRATVSETSVGLSGFFSQPCCSSRTRNIYFW